MEKIIGQKIGGGSSILTTPIQVTGLKATGKDGGVALSIDPPTEASYPYLKDYWVVWKKKADGPIQHPYDGAHMTFAAGSPISGQTLANLTAGSTLKIVENNTPVQFLVLQHGYPSSGGGNTLLLRKNIYSNMKFGGSGAYSGSTVDNFLTNNYLLLLDSTVRSSLVRVSIPCYSVGQTSNIDRSIFLLSGTELGFSTSSMPIEGTAIPYFASNESRIAYLNQTVSPYWTRSISTNTSRYSWYVLSTGTYYNDFNNSSIGVRPAFCLPGTTQVSLEPDSDGDYTLV